MSLWILCPIISFVDVVVVVVFCLEVLYHHRIVIDEWHKIEFMNIQHMPTSIHTNHSEGNKKKTKAMKNMENCLNIERSSIIFCLVLNNCSGSNETNQPHVYLLFFVFFFSVVLFLEPMLYPYYLPLCINIYSTFRFRHIRFINFLLRCLSVHTA